MNRTIATIATVSALTFGAAAFAQTTPMGTGEGYDMLQAAITSDFERLGIESEGMDMDALTLGQLAAIKGVLESEDTENQQKGQIEAIIANN